MRTATQGVQAGWADFLIVMVEINVFIGLLNLLPMLPLDGGHVLIAVYERIRSRKGRPYHADVAKLSLHRLLPSCCSWHSSVAFYLDLTLRYPTPSMTLANELGKWTWQAIA